MIKELYEQDYRLLEIISNDWDWTVIVKTPYLSNEEWDIWLEKESFSMNLQGLTSFLRSLTTEGYDKYWNNNYYVLKWAWHKSVDIINLLSELQQDDEKYSELTDKEKINIYKEIITLSKKEIDSLQNKSKKWQKQE